MGVREGERETGVKEGGRETHVREGDTYTPILSWGLPARSPQCNYTCIHCIYMYMYMYISTVYVLYVQGILISLLPTTHRRWRGMSTVRVWSAGLIRRLRPLHTLLPGHRPFLIYPTARPSQSYICKCTCTCTCYAVHVYKDTLNTLTSTWVA